MTSFERSHSETLGSELQHEFFGETQLSLEQVVSSGSPIDPGVRCWRDSGRALKFGRAEGVPSEVKELRRRRWPSPFALFPSSFWKNTSGSVHLAVETLPAVFGC